MTDYHQDAYPGVIRRKDLLALIIGASPESNILSSLLSARNVSIRELSETEVAKAGHVEVEEWLHCSKTVWDSQRRQILLVGSLTSSAFVTFALKVCRTPHEIFVCVEPHNSTPSNDLQVIRVSKAGAHLIGFSDALDELE